MRLQSLDFALGLLNHFTLEKPIWGVRKLASKVLRHPSVVQRALATLEAHDFLQQDSNKEYRLGYKCILLGRLSNESLNFSAKINTILMPVVEKIDENIFFYKQDNDDAVCHHIVESSQPFNFSTKLGHRITLHSAPFTKIILAYQQQSWLDEYLLSLDSTTKKALLTDLEILKIQGFAYSKEALFRGTHGISVPVFNNRHCIVGSLCIAIHLKNNDQNIEKYLPLLKEAAIKMSSIFI